MDIEEDKQDFQQFTPEFLEIVKNDTIKHYKKIRNELLQETDKYVLIDYPITAEKLIQIKEYRQQLRDFTLNDYILPEKPDFLILLNY